MNSKERILAALEGRPADRVPILFWCFGFPAPPGLGWQTDGRPVPYWYTNRLEHIHTLPYPWKLEDEFRRAEAWLSIGVDDMLEVSVPWSHDPAVTFEDKLLPPGATGGDPRYPVMFRRYTTPAGSLEHAAKRTGPEAPGWPVQPDLVALLEDYNVARATKHAVTTPAEVSLVRHLFMAPDESQRWWFADRISQMRPFAQERGLLVQAWSAFGMDAAVWLTGTEGAVMMAMDAPDDFARLIDLIAETDYARTELAASTDGVDLVCQRGWYSSTDFWSPKLFDKYVYPHVAEMAAVAHRYGKKFGYVLTTGVAALGPRLADAGVDLLYYVDPLLDKVTAETARDLLAGRMTIVGGTNAIRLASGDKQAIRSEVQHAIDVLGPTNRFVLSATDALFPDTPWEGVQEMIRAWQEKT